MTSTLGPIRVIETRSRNIVSPRASKRPPLLRLSCTSRLTTGTFYAAAAALDRQPRLHRCRVRSKVAANKVGGTPPLEGEAVQPPDEPPEGSEEEEQAQFDIGLPSETKRATVFRPLIPKFGVSNMAGAPDRAEGVLYQYQGLTVPICEPKFSYIYVMAQVSVLGLLGLSGLIYGEETRDQLFTALANQHSSVWQGEYFRLLTANWLFSDWLDMTLNTVALLFVAPEVEALFGYARFNFIAFMVGLAGSAASLVWGRGDLSLGGEHMLYGLLGAYAVYCARHGRANLRITQLLFILLVLNYNLLGGDQISLAVAAGAGGLFALGLGPLFGVQQGSFFQSTDDDEDPEALPPLWAPRNDVTASDEDFDPEAAFLVDRVGWTQGFATGIGFYGILVAVLLLNSPAGTLVPGQGSAYWEKVLSLFG